MCSILLGYLSISKYEDYCSILCIDYTRQLCIISRANFYLAACFHFFSPLYLDSSWYVIFTLSSDYNFKKKFSYINLFVGLYIFDLLLFL